MPLTIVNHPPDSTLFIPDTLVHGYSSQPQGIIHVVHHNNCFPPQSFEVNGGVFKLLVHLQQGKNNLTFTQHAGTFRNGQPLYDRNPAYPPIQLNYSLNYAPQLQNPPVHLCLLVAKDSPGNFDSPQYKRNFEGNNIQTAIRKLRFAARLMQAFTAEQMARNGMGNRCFRFEEEVANDTISRQENGQVQRSTVKVHVITVDKTVAEIRDPNVAQQNSKGNNTGALFGWAGDAVKKYGITTKNSTAACIYLDAHWDKQQNLLTGHAALGGSINDLRLAIFGSHGLWSWPNCYEELYPAFSDCTATDTNAVVNDCNECGSAWEACNVSLGAFLHECGHALGCPHQPNGIMLRDYVTWNRSFMSREFPATRTGKQGYAPVLPKDECGWHRLDIMRFLYHPAFRMPIDYQDDTIPKDAWENGSDPSYVALSDKQVLITSDTGVYLVEVHVDGQCRAHLEYLSRLSSRGPGPKRKLVLGYNDIQAILAPEYRNKKVKLDILAVGLKQCSIDDFAGLFETVQVNVPGIGELQGFKTRLLGQRNGSDTGVVSFDPRSITKIRIYHGLALDGLTVYYKEYVPQATTAAAAAAAQPTPAPQKSRSSDGFFRKLKKDIFSQIPQSSQSSIQSFLNSNDNNANSNGPTREATFGNIKPHYTDFSFNTGANEKLVKFNVKCGAWIDAVQIVTNLRQSQWFGNADGGGQAELGPPETDQNQEHGKQYALVAVLGNIGSWANSIQGIYAKV